MEEAIYMELIPLSDRQTRELAYHQAYASDHAHEHRTITFDCLDPRQRRWWNAHWEVFYRVRSLALKGKRGLVIGCGFGEDALLLSKLGADVYAFDLSGDMIDAGASLAANYGLPIHFDRMAAEQLTYPNAFFDIVLAIDILHHCELAQSLGEIRRVAKPGALVIINEIYTHSYLQRIRESRVVSRYVYPSIARLLYGSSPYITEDEQKLNEQDLATLLAAFEPRQLSFFGVVVKRLIPEWVPWIAKLDRLFLWALGSFGRLLAGRFVLVASR